MSKSGASAAGMAIMDAASAGVQSAERKHSSKSGMIIPCNRDMCYAMRPQKTVGNNMAAGGEAAQWNVHASAWTGGS